MILHGGCGGPSRGRGRWSDQESVEEEAGSGEDGASNAGIRAVGVCAVASGVR